VVAGIKIGNASKAVLQPLDAVTDAAAKQAIDEAIKKASAIDGDRVLDKFEAEAIRAAYDEVVQNAGALNASTAGQFSSAVDARIALLKSARPPSTDVVFTSNTDALVVFRQKILGSIDETLQRANGKKVDVNMMLFAFTDKTLADEIAKRCRDNSNLTVRILTDWSQLPESGDRQPARLSKMNLPNLIVKFKKDAPYTWNNQRGPEYNHGATQGLNHHKGFVTLIEGRPEKMTAGSFNWSVGAMEDNYENLMVLDRKDVDNRALMESYQTEFEGFWNDDRVALSHREALVEKERLYAALHAANNKPYTPRNITTPALVDVHYDVNDTSPKFDINSFQDADVAKMKDLIGTTKLNAILKELRDFGRFDDVDELFERVPTLSSLSAEKQASLRELAEFGEGGLSVNRATVSELDRAGFSKRQAEKIVSYLQTYGAIENLDELKAAAGLPDATLRRVSPSLSANEVIATYSAKIPGTGNATTGWAPEHNGTTTIAKSVDSNGVRTVEQVNRDMASGVADMLRRAPVGETFRLAMYGISPTAPEFLEMVKAAERGVPIRAVLYNEYNQPAIDALKALQARGLDVQVKIIKSRVMHQKFGVCGDDVFNGSANFSLSSITKHTEDRFVFRNMKELADKFRAEFDLLWSRASDA
jgi:phosphatidylserine/phosphatidylglycerophosphate/cardiolipin synthase-like enzyme